VGNIEGVIGRGLGLKMVGDGEEEEGWNMERGIYN
jgi:hypothetical protein